MNDKRDRIIAAARARFRSYGFKKTTMQEIADDANVAVGTLYLHFKNKDELLLAGIDDYVDRHRCEADAALNARGKIASRLRRYLLARYEQADELCRGSTHAAQLSAEVLRVRPERYQDEIRMMYETLVRLLQAGVDAEELRIANPRRDAGVFLSAVASTLPNPFNEHGRPGSSSELLFVLDWFLDIWRAREGHINDVPLVPRRGRRRIPRGT